MRIHLPFFRKKKFKSPLKYNSWDEISIKMYDDIVKTTRDESLSEFEKNVKILALLWDKSEDEIMNMNITDIEETNKYTSFLSDFKFDNKKRPKTLMIGDTECEINYDLKEMCYAQFVDFQTYYQMGVDEHIQHILSTVIIPKGKRYGEGYNVDEHIDAIYNEMPITTSQSVLFFFVRRLVSSYKSSRTSLISMMKKMMKKEKNPQMKKKLEEIQSLLYGSTV